MRLKVSKRNGVCVYKCGDVEISRNEYLKLRDTSKMLIMGGMEQLTSRSQRGMDVPLAQQNNKFILQDLVNDFPLTEEKMDGDLHVYKQGDSICIKTNSFAYHGTDIVTKINTFITGESIDNKTLDLNIELADTTKNSCLCLLVSLRPLFDDDIKTIRLSLKRKPQTDGGEGTNPGKGDDGGESKADNYSEDTIVGNLIQDYQNFTMLSDGTWSVDENVLVWDQNQVAVDE